MTRVLVIGATGNQGGAVVDELLAAEESFEVYGLTRDSSTDRAQELADQGVTVVEGDLNDPESLRDPISAVDAVFLVTNFWTEGYDQQVDQGKHVVDICAEEGIDHIVFSGVGSHWEDTGVPHFDSAADIEAYLHEQDLPVTVLGPVFFFQNLEAFIEDIIEDNTLALPLTPDTSLQMVDVRDVGRVATQIFAAPEQYIGERFELAGDEQTLDETATVISAVSGIDVEPYHVPIEDAYESFGEEFTVMCEWFNNVGYSADISALEDEFDIDLVDLETYLHDHGWADKTGMATTPGWVKAFS